MQARSSSCFPSLPLRIGQLAAGVLIIVWSVATMLPYLAAIALIANSDLGWQLTGGVLAGYCAVMVVPATALAIARLAAHQRMDPPLQRRLRSAAYRPGRR
ncbi:GAP family protein [Nonomuraea sp. B10E15]|uniref:GAP family protein n=1 Tax=Nonomuraea sp. B10E15 TaxID=3153560 RepID=UPI00325EA15D